MLHKTTQTTIIKSMPRKLARIGARGLCVILPSLWISELLGDYVNPADISAKNAPFVQVTQMDDGAIVINRVQSDTAPAPKRTTPTPSVLTKPAPPVVPNPSIWMYAQTPEELPPVMLDRYSKFVKSLPVHLLKRDDKTDIAHTWIMAYNEGLPKSKPERDELLASAEQMLHDCYTLDDFDI